MTDWETGRQAVTDWETGGHRLGDRLGDRQTGWQADWETDWEADWETLPLSVMMRGTSFSAGEKHLMRFPSTSPSISARFSKVQLTPAESSGTLWASRTNCSQTGREEEPE